MHTLPHVQFRMHKPFLLPQIIITVHSSTHNDLRYSTLRTTFLMHSHMKIYKTSGPNLHTFLIGNISYGKFLSLKNTQLFHKIII